LLIRRAAWEEVGGLDLSLRYSMDLDLLLRLRRLGPFVAVPSPVATFRWHTESLTVSQREASLAEAQEVKRRQLGAIARTCAPLWEGPVRYATRKAAGRVNARAAKLIVA
jgi:GT2 family glycosyltransferase